MRPFFETTSKAKCPRLVLHVLVIKFSVVSPDSDENYFKVRLPTLNLQFKLHDDISNPMNESLIYRIRP